VFSQVNEETQKTEFWASVGNDNAGNSVVKIEENTWYDVTILFAEDANAFSRVYIGNTFIGTVKGTIVGTQARWGFANFSGCSGGGEQNAAAYQIDDFTASTEAELRLFNPMVTDFMISVRRSQVGKPQPFNAVLVSDWAGQMTHCAFMMTEDDGGTKTEWKCTALVRIESKSYGIEMNLPFNSRDDIVWRGRIAWSWLEANSGKTGHFGDVDLKFEIIEY
jgi:hypothetical protein